MTQNIFNTNRIIRSCLLPLFFLPVAAGLSNPAAAANASGSQSTALMQQMGAKESGPSSIACSVRKIGVLGNRIHILCNNTSGKIRYFAAGSKDINTDRYVALSATAKSRNQSINIHFDANSAANPVSCLATDCRKITAMFW